MPKKFNFRYHYLEDIPKLWWWPWSGVVGHFTRSIQFFQGGIQQSADGDHTGIIMLVHVGVGHLINLSYFFAVILIMSPDAKAWFYSSKVHLNCLDNDLYSKEKTLMQFALFFAIQIWFWKEEYRYLCLFRNYYCILLSG